MSERAAEGSDWGIARELTPREWLRRAGVVRIIVICWFIELLVYLNVLEYG